MKVRQLKIKNFRGIRHLDWKPKSNIVCLIGPGDSTKSTILDAIEFVLSPKWNLPFDDTDFYNENHTSPIEIEATIGELPDKVIKIDKFGLELRGWSASEELHDEPEEADEKVLTIKLSVDSSLEPHWYILNSRNETEGKTISSKERELFSTARLGTTVERHLSWGRGSILTKLTEDVKEAPALLAEVVRQAKRSLTPENLPSLKIALSAATTQAQRIGVRARNTYEARLDFQAQNLHLGCLSMHEDGIPLRNAGFGSRRLITIALQHHTSKEGGITLIDEVEHGLEPHRIRRLLKVLKESSGAEVSGSQTFLTTHSSVPIVELSAENLHITRRADGVTSVLQVPSSLQNIVRKVPEAFLAAKILVCEGPTEVGFCQALEQHWLNEGKNSFAYQGLITVTGRSGGGSDTPEIAKELRSLGYEVGLLIDSDDPKLSPSVKELEKLGIKVIQWEGNCSIEQRIFHDLQDDGCIELVQLAIDIKNEESDFQNNFDAIRQAVQSRTTPTVEIDNDISQWLTVDNAENIRNAIGLAAAGKKKDGTDGKNAWFKTHSKGEEMGIVICKYLRQTPSTNLEMKIEELKKWVFKDDDSNSSSGSH